MTDKYLDYIYKLAEDATKDVDEPTEKHVRDAVGSIGYFSLMETGLLEQLWERNGSKRYCRAHS